MLLKKCAGYIFSIIYFDFFFHIYSNLQFSELMATELQLHSQLANIYFFLNFACRLPLNSPLLDVKVSVRIPGQTSPTKRNISPATSSQQITGKNFESK